MSTINISKSLVLGEVTLTRLASIAMPKELAAITKTVATTFAAFKKAAAKVEAVAVTRASAQAVAGVATQKVASSVAALVGAVVENDGSKRLRPLADFGAKSAAQLTRGTRGVVAKRVGAVAAKVASSKPTKGVESAGVACAIAARALGRAHAKVIPQNVAFDEARATRDAALADFTVAYEMAVQVGKRVWKAKPAQFDAVFGPLEATFYSPKRRPAEATTADAAAVKKTPKRAKKGATEATTAATTSPPSASKVTTTLAAAAAPVSVPPAAT